MKIVFTQDEIKEIITKTLKEKYSGLLEENQVITEIENIGNSYSDVQVIIEEKEETK